MDYRDYCENSTGHNFLIFSARDLIFWILAHIIETRKRIRNHARFGHFPFCGSWGLPLYTVCYCMQVDYDDVFLLTDKRRRIAVGVGAAAQSGQKSHDQLLCLAAKVFGWMWNHIKFQIYVIIQPLQEGYILRCSLLQERCIFCHFCGLVLISGSCPGKIGTLQEGVYCLFTSTRGVDKLVFCEAASTFGSCLAGICTLQEGHYCVVYLYKSSHQGLYIA